MSENPRIAFFDAIARRWDGLMDLAVVARKLDEGLAAFGAAQDELVLDVGCGTGNLTSALLRRLGPDGRVIAVDIALKMIEEARRKVDDARVKWFAAAAARLPVENDVIDRVICFSVWPHFPDPMAVAVELLRVLKPGGKLHVWHIDSRETINRVHAGAGEAVHHNVLVPAVELRLLLARCGFDQIEMHDDDEGYLVGARKPAG